jgi:hypothetical protein
MPPTYQVLDWDKWFETAKSRTYKVCSKAYLPNKQGGMGMSYILSLPDGGCVYGVWCLIVGALSQQPLPRDGWLTHDGTEAGTPWTIGEMALRWRRKEKEIERALQVFTSTSVRWARILHGYHTDTKYPHSAVKTDTCIQTDTDTQTSNRSGFSEFWESWPAHKRKQDRKKCLGFWETHKLHTKAEDVMRGLGLWKRSVAWAQDGGEFIPMPHTWLNNERWTERPQLAEEEIAPPLTDADLEEIKTW